MNSRFAFLRVIVFILLPVSIFAFYRAVNSVYNEAANYVTATAVLEAQLVADLSLSQSMTATMAAGETQSALQTIEAETTLAAIQAFQSAGTAQASAEFATATAQANQAADARISTEQANSSATAVLLTASSEASAATMNAVNTQIAITRTAPYLTMTSIVEIKTLEAQFGSLTPPATNTATPPPTDLPTNTPLPNCQVNPRGNTAKAYTLPTTLLSPSAEIPSGQSVTMLHTASDNAWILVDYVGQSFWVQRQEMELGPVCINVLPISIGEIYARTVPGYTVLISDDFGIQNTGAWTTNAGDPTWQEFNGERVLQLRHISAPPLLLQYTPLNTSTIGADLDLSFAYSLANTSTQSYIGVQFYRTGEDYYEVRLRRQNCSIEFVRGSSTGERTIGERPEIIPNCSQANQPQQVHLTVQNNLVSINMQGGIAIQFGLETTSPMAPGMVNFTLNNDMANLFYVILLGR